MRQIKGNVSPMSNEGRNAYVIGHITDALLKLLREKPIEAISISELCGLAGIGRASFYRNFNSKEDILRSYIHGLFRNGRRESLRRRTGRSASFSAPCFPILKNTGIFTSCLTGGASLTF